MEMENVVQIMGFLLMFHYGPATVKAVFHKETGVSGNVVFLHALGWTCFLHPLVKLF